MGSIVFKKNFVGATAPLIILLLLSGCTPSLEVSSPSTPIPTATGKQEMTPSPIPAISSTPGDSELHGLSLGKSCSDIVGVQRLYDFNPNYSRVTESSPPADSLADQIRALQGISCTYMNLSSGETIHLLVARLDRVSISVLNRRVAAMSPFDITFDGGRSVAAGFSQSAEGGVSMLIIDDLWLVVNSATFLAATDSSDFFSAILPGL